MSIVIIVHGESNRSEQLKMDTKLRCDKAYQIWLAYKNNLRCLICSGGLFEPGQKGIAVSIAMKNYLITLGIPAECIVCETASRTTIENVEMTSPLLRPGDFLHVVTSDYHVPRTEKSWILQGGQNKGTCIMHGAMTPDLAPADLPADEKTLAEKRKVEMIGIIVVWLYRFGIRYPDELMRRRRENSLKQIR